MIGGRIARQQEARRAARRPWRVAGLASGHQRRVNRARKRRRDRPRAPAGSLRLCARPGGRVGFSSAVSAGAGGGRRRRGCRGWLLLEAEILEDVPALLFLRALRVRRSAPGSRTSGRARRAAHCLADILARIDMAPRAGRRPAIANATPPVVAAAAELPLAHLVVREGERGLRKNGRMTGVAAERLVRPVREQRPRRDGARPGSRRGMRSTAGKAAPSATVADASPSATARRRSQTAAGPRGGGPHTAPFLFMLRQTARRKSSAAREHQRHADRRRQDERRRRPVERGPELEQRGRARPRTAARRMPRVVSSLAPWFDSGGVIAPARAVGRPPSPCRGRSGGRRGTTSSPRRAPRGPGGGRRLRRSDARHRGNEGSSSLGRACRARSCPAPRPT